MADLENDIEKKIIEAAKSAFLEKGYLGTTMRDIAKTAGVNVAMLNYYFRSKDRLFDRIFLEQFNLMVSTIVTNALTATGLMEKIRSIIDNVVDNLTQHPYLPVFVITEINRDPERFFATVNFNNVPDNLGVFLRQVEAEIKKGAIRPVDPHQLLINIIALSIFPFLAKPIIYNVLEVEEEKYEQLLDGRKEEIFKTIESRLKI